MRAFIIIIINFYDLAVLLSEGSYTRVEVYRDPATDKKRSLLAWADPAEAALIKYQKFQQGKWHKEILGVNGRTIAALL